MAIVVLLSQTDQICQLRHRDYAELFWLLAVRMCDLLDGSYLLWSLHFTALLVYIAVLDLDGDVEISFGMVLLANPILHQR